MTYLVVYIHQYHKIRPHEKTSGEICGLGPHPNLASHIFSQAQRQVSQGWDGRYKVTPALMETFVEIPRFTGACIRPLDGSMSVQPGGAANTTLGTNA